jgi:hypothetical protein
MADPAGGTSIIHDECFEKVSTGLRRVGDEFQRYVKRFIDKNSESLFSNQMGGRISYGPEVEGELFRFCGIRREELQAAMSKTDVIQGHWKVGNEPVYYLLLLAQRHFLRAKRSEDQHLALMMFGIISYSIQQRRYFKYASGTGFDNIMNYTINQLSQKFLLKQHGTVYGALEATLEKSGATYSELVASEKDSDSLLYVTNTSSRINNWVQNFAKEFYKNRENGKYLNIDQEVDPNEGFLRDTTNVSMAITKMTENAMLVSRMNTPSTRIARLLAMSNGISQPELISAVEQINRKEEDRLRDLIRTILTIFLVDQQQHADDICSTKFVLYSLRAYSKSHTKEPNVLALKKTLDDLLGDYSETYVKTQRAATQINLRKALFQYYVSHIQTTVCSN